MASLLREAAQQGILDVHLVMLTHHQWLTVPQDRVGYGRFDRDEDAKVQDSETTVEQWTRLDGSQPEWEKEKLDKKSDRILQVRSHVWGPAKHCVP